MFTLTQPAVPVTPAPASPWRLRLLTTATVALLAACGGGGDGSDDSAAADAVGPPTVAATLVNTPTEAQQSASTTVAGADTALQRFSAMNAFSAFLGEPVIPLSAAPRGQKQALAVQTAVCADLFDPPCAGTAAVDTNVADNATVLNPGDWVDIRFQSLSGAMFGAQLAFDGHVRMDFLSSLNLNATSFNGLDMKLSFDGLGGTVNGAAFGPVSDVFRLQINAQGASTITAGGASYTGLTGVDITGSGHYAIAGGTVRLGYWGDTSRYVDLGFQNWRVVAGRPAVGATASITSGQGTASLRVMASSSASVVYAVTLTAGGSTTAYTVTATYPSGGGVPTYLAVLAAV